jgi:transglutaminase-like putative cysteine protease
MRLERPAAGWSSVLLVTLMLLSVAWALEAQTINVLGLEVLTFAVFGGVLTGLVLGSLDWMPATLAHGWAVVASIFGATFLATFALGNYTVALDRFSMTLEGQSLIDRMGIVRTWFFTWLRAVTGGGFPDPDMANLVFVFAMGLLLWLISYVCIWFVVRYVSWWGAVLPSGFALLTALYQSQQRYMIYLVFFLFCALLLAAKTHLALQEDRWRREHIGFSSDMHFDVIRDGLVVALLVVGFGWLAPTDVNNGALSGLMNRLTGASSQLNTQLTRWFPDVRLPVRGSGSSFGNQLPLGGSISLNRDPVFDLTVEDAEAPRYYRMAVFDQYAGNTWLRNPSSVREGNAGELDLAEDYALTRPVTQTIQPFLPIVQQLYAAPQPEQFSIPVRAAVAEGPGAGDVMSVESQAPLTVGQNAYTVVSRLTYADEVSLRAASIQDPVWVTERYLGLPSSVPDTVHDLAQQIVAANAGQSRYEQATAIQNYLRANMTYSEKIDTPPSDRDRVEWFLFDQKRGYCDYYASAFVVLARSVGIPARFVAGYSRPAMPEANGNWRLRNMDAHTWPEVYFPEYGWVEFEPTASDQVISRPGQLASGLATPTPQTTPGGPNADPTAEPEVFPDQPKPNGGPGNLAAGGIDLASLALRLGLLVAGLAACVALAFVAWQRPLRGLSVGERAFAQFVQLARLVGLRPRPVETPFEYGARVAGAIPEASGEISTITDAYVRERFARRPADGEAGRLAQAWLSLRKTLLRDGTRWRLQRFRRSR